MTAVQVEAVWKFFGEFAALRDVSLDVAEGSCLALLGRNGAGKTTLLRILSGLSRPARGRVLVRGADLKESSVRRQIGMLGHGIGVYDELSAMENLRLFARLNEMSDVDGLAERWLELVGLGRVRNGLAREFSRGMRQRLAIARAFIHDPAVLLLDEPFTSLDDRAIAVLQGLLRQALAAGRTVIMSTHQLREALELATHVALVQRGTIVHKGIRTPEMAADPGFLYRTYGEQ